MMRWTDRVMMMNGSFGGVVMRRLRHRFRDLDHRCLALGHRTSVVPRCRESRAAQRDTGDTSHHHFRNHLVHITPTFLQLSC